MLLAGTAVTTGEGKAVVASTGRHTEFGKIAHLAQTSGSAVSPLRRQLAALSRLIASLAVGVGLLFLRPAPSSVCRFGRTSFCRSGSSSRWCPEGLLPTLTLALVLAAKRMARRNVLIRHLASVETLGSATVICTDKTGTLTRNRMEARELLLGRDRYLTSDFAGTKENSGRFADFFQAANLCHDLKVTTDRGNRVVLGDPTEAALVEMAQRVIGDVPTPRRLRDLPFDANRMRHSVLYAAAGGPVLYCRGAPEALLPECRRIHGGGGIEALDDSTRQTIVEAQEGMAERGLRVLAFALRRRVVADSEEALERDLTFLGLVGLEDPPRPEVPGAIRKCHDAGIKIVMVTGDHPRSAVAIAREIGLVRSADPTVLGGERLRRLSASDLARALCGGACSTGMRELAASAWRAEPCAR